MKKLILLLAVALWADAVPVSAALRPVHPVQDNPCPDDEDPGDENPE